MNQIKPYLEMTNTYVILPKFLVAISRIMIGFEVLDYRGGLQGPTLPPPPAGGEM